MILIMITKFVGSIIRRKIKVTYKLNKPNLLSSIKRNKSWFEISCFNSGRDSETNYSPPQPAQVKAMCQWKEKCLVFEKWLNNVKHLTHVLLLQSPRNILKHWCFKFYIRICWRCPERQWTCWLVPLLSGKVVEVYTIIDGEGAWYTEDLKTTLMTKFTISSKVYWQKFWLNTGPPGENTTLRSKWPLLLPEQPKIFNSVSGSSVHNIKVQIWHRKGFF